MTKANWTARSKHKQGRLVVYLDFESTAHFVPQKQIWTHYRGHISVNRNRTRIAGWEKGSNHRVLTFEARCYPPYDTLTVEIRQIDSSDTVVMYSSAVEKPADLNLDWIREEIATRAHQFLENHFVHA